MAQKKYTPMLGRAHAHMMAEDIPRTSAAYEAVHELIALRRASPWLRLTDRIETRLEVWLLGLPSQERVGRGCDVEHAKARCIRAGIAHEVIDFIFPERPSATEAQEWLDRGHKVKGDDPLAGLQEQPNV